MNDDVRSLLATTDTAKRDLARKVVEKELRREKRQKKQHQYQERKRQRCESMTDASPFIDRAKERRRHEERLAAEIESAKKRSEADSKILGGDTDRTHLVKGLDTSLLKKIRDEINAAQREVVEKSPAQWTEMASAVVAAINSSHPHHINFTETADLPPLTTAVHRRAYLFETTARVQRHEIPTASICGDSVEPQRTAAMPHPLIIQALQEIHEWHRQNKKKPRGERLPTRPPTTTLAAFLKVEPETLPEEKNKHEESDEQSEQSEESQESEESDDIFSGVGGYDTSEAQQQAKLQPFADAEDLVL